MGFFPWFHCKVYESSYQWQKKDYHQPVKRNEVPFIVSVIKVYKCQYSKQERYDITNHNYCIHYYCSGVKSLSVSFAHHTIHAAVIDVAQPKYPPANAHKKSHSGSLAHKPHASPIHPQVHAHQCCF